MLPVTDEQAKAIQKSPEFGTTIVGETGQLARYVGRVLGTAPEDAFAVVIGEPLRYLRARIAYEVDERLTRIFNSRGIKNPQPISPSLALPLLNAAYDESRPELQELWALLIAAAMDPKKASQVRRSFIDTLKSFDPLDALILKEIYGVPDAGTLSPNTRDFLASKLQLSRSDIILSATNLNKLGCIAPLNAGMGGEFPQFIITTYGRALIRACMD